MINTKKNRRLKVAAALTTVPAILMTTGCGTQKGPVFAKAMYVEGMNGEILKSAPVKGEQRIERQKIVSVKETYSEGTKTKTEKPTEIVRYTPGTRAVTEKCEGTEDCYRVVRKGTPSTTTRTKGKNVPVEDVAKIEGVKETTTTTTEVEIRSGDADSSPFVVGYTIPTTPLDPTVMVLAVKPVTEATFGEMVTQPVIGEARYKVLMDGIGSAALGVGVGAGRVLTGFADIRAADAANKEADASQTFAERWAPDVYQDNSSIVTTSKADPTATTGAVDASSQNKNVQMAQQEASPTVQQEASPTMQQEASPTMQQEASPVHQVEVNQESRPVSYNNASPVIKVEGSETQINNNPQIETNAAAVSKPVTQVETNAAALSKPVTQVENNNTALSKPITQVETNAVAAAKSEAQAVGTNPVRPTKTSPKGHNGCEKNECK